MLTASLLLAPLLVPQQPERPFALMLGDPAPAILVAEWVQGQPITRFEPGQTYVVEFWATWCGPCKVAIPHLNELSKKYAGQVRFVGVSVWENISPDEPYAVPEFVKGMGERMTYAVASDRTTAAKNEEEEGPMAKNWMAAAGQGGIPTAFIVNAQGRIAWMGHPMSIDKPLADVVAGKWDVDAAAKKYALDLRTKGAVTKVRSEVTKLKKEKDFAGALRAIEAAIAGDALLESYFGLEKYFLLLEAQRAPEAATYGRRLVGTVLADNANALNQLAWGIVDPAKERAGDYELSVLAAERAVELLKGSDASTLDTLGLALFKSGKVARAIEVQKKAVELAQGSGDFEMEFKQRLAQFKNANRTP
jgi:thiol-disulfide isomerase/thioredoxin